jgi:hypothetical protein
MLFFTLSCSSRKQVTVRQAETHCHGNALLACQHDDHARAAIRLLEAQERIAEVVQTCRSAALLLRPSIREECLWRT